MLKSKLTVKHRSFCFAKCTLKKSLWTLKLVMKWCKLTTMGWKSTGKWSWVCMWLSKSSHTKHTLLELGLEWWCKVHCSVPLCSSELNCQTLGHRSTSNFWHKWLTMKKWWKSEWRVKRCLKCCHKLCKSMIVNNKRRKSQKCPTFLKRCHLGLKLWFKWHSTHSKKGSH